MSSISVLTMSEAKSEVKLSRNSEENCEVELPLKEQFQRLNLLLLGIASILLVNITAVLVYSAKFPEQEKERFYFQENIKAKGKKSSTKNSSILH